MRAAWVVALLGAGVAWSARAAEPVEFNRDIRPILSNACFKCHGPDPAERQGGGEGGLRLDDETGALADLGGYAAVVRGQPDDSELIQRITTDDADLVMPPPASGPRLGPREVALLSTWIEQGAPFARHWSYVVPVRPAVPQVQQQDWPRNDIDRFLLARLEREGLAPAPEADRAVLIRRVMLDLIGLPPTLDELDQFLADERPDAYEQLVDRLLADPAYGEHWARLWLDLARYADSAGYADDPPRTIWAYRDYVIRAFNENKPFDQFSIEQLAGDLLPAPSEDQLIATAFHRNTPTNNEGGTNDEEFRSVAVVDRVNTTLAVWMGTTMACAQCHTHKYDPLSQEEYFQLFALLNQTEDADHGDERPVLELVSDNGPSTTVPILRELPADRRRKTHLQYRGNFLDLGPEVQPGVPAAFHPLPPDVPADRLALARWLVDDRNPLTARVLANRYWEQLFGVGIVRTSEEFGSQGELPTHPELLDWLATELLRQRWDLRQFLKLLVTSAAYRQSSRVTPELQERDPDNLLLARGPRFRLAAEVVRDQALAVSGLLSRKRYGPPVKPPQPALGLKAAFGSGIDWKTSEGEDRYRRGVYTTWRRSNPYPSLAAFDAPNREVCTLRRDRTNTPLQALVTLNDPVYIEAAQSLARQLAALDATLEDKIDHGFRRCVARRPSDAERTGLVQLFATARDRFSQTPERALQFASDPLGPLPEGADPSTLAAWTLVGNVLLNLDELLMKK